MRLVRFLAAGKSLVGLKDTEGRYQLPKSRALPQFGGVRDVGVPAGVEPTRQPHQEASVGRGMPTNAGIGTPSGAVEASFGPALNPAQPKPQPSKGSQGESRTILRKFFGWLPWCREHSAAGAIPAFSRLAVQTELSLENVKVVRNDLSESDLEFLSSRGKAALNPFSKQQVGEPVEVVVTPQDPSGNGSVASGN